LATCPTAGGEMMQTTSWTETSWWLDESALPDRFLWARLQVAEDGSAVVLDLDGVYHRFEDRQLAHYWLIEDEYSPWTELVQDGEIGADVTPPVATSDQELVPHMAVCVRRDRS
jgi:hypothetical protein